ncbi:MAG: DNA polymerase III subunit gamma/tau [Phycisphaerae bacterium]|nr:DNA polymerase III subunit gamma/tau [Phycisphaerae bacterium]
MAKQASKSPATDPTPRPKREGAKADAKTPAAKSDAAATPANYQVLARRYRSKDFGEVVGQDAIARTLQNAMRTGRTAHAYLFCGTRGVGKTSMARIFARALNAVDTLSEQDAVAGAIMRGEDLDVIEIDAASNRGIDSARDLIAGASLMPARGSYKIYIIDEVHMLTTPAFNALLKTMEEPPAHVKFILCTTEPQSVPATIQSRCQRFDFRSIPTVKIADHLREVLTGEHADAEERVVMQIARMANGSMRDALSLLERLLAAAVPDEGGRPMLSWTLLEDIFGLPDETLVENAIDAIGRSDAATALTLGGELLDRGLSIERALDLLAERYRWMLLAKVCGKDTPMLEVASETREAMVRLGAAFDSAALVHLVALCDAVASKARDASSPRALYDAAIVRMCLSEQFAEAAGLLVNNGASSGNNGKVQAPPGKAPPRAAEQQTRPAAPFNLKPANLTPARLTPADRGLESKPTVARSAPATLTPVTLTKAQVPSDTAPQSASNSDGFWQEIVGKASSSARDGALLAGLVCQSWDGRTLTLTAREGEAGAGFLASNPDVVKSTVQRLAGRPLDVRFDLITVPLSRPPAAQRGRIPREVREHPVIRLAVELFDASIVDCTPLRRGEVVPDVVSGEIAQPLHDDHEHHDEPEGLSQEG